MKLQCSCGAKYSFDATPDMLKNPVKFICPSCGLDASDFVNELVRHEFGGLVPPPPPPPPGPVPHLKVSSAAAPAVPPPETAPASKFCARHRERATEKCAVCQKPICPKCLEMFGYFCSPLCKGKAEAEHLQVPVYAGDQNAVEALFWRKMGLVAGGIGLLLVLFLGGWIWYAWFGAVPHKLFSVRFEDTDRGYYGSSQLVGLDQIVFLHGGTLARYNLKTGQPVWSQNLISSQQLDFLIKLQNEEQARQNEGLGYHNHRSAEAIERTAKQFLQSELVLHVSGQNIWVASVGKLSHFDWDTGKVVGEISLPERGGELVEQGGDLAVVGQYSVTHVSLAGGDSRVERFGTPGTPGATAELAEAGGGLPSTAAQGDRQRIDPEKVEAQAQNLNLQGRIVLPALLGNAHYEEEIEAALNDQPAVNHPPAANNASVGTEHSQLVAGTTDFAQLSSRLLETRLAIRSAMKAPSKNAGVGDVNAMLNEQQRNDGGDLVTNDESRYQVTLHLPDHAGAVDWTGEVAGPPQLFVLPTVNVIAADKNLVVLDKNNKQLWQASLTYPVPAPPARTHFARPDTTYGAGPCVEHGNTLYVFDQAVLTAYGLTSGDARWRLPSVGIVGLFFDDQDHVYVNTTTGNPDDINYSKQIDIDRHLDDVFFKIDGQTGKTLWSVKPGGFVSYVAGKFIYAVEGYDPNPTDEEVMNDMTASLQKPAYLRIARVNPDNGRIKWEYYDRDRCPVHWSFADNSLELIFKREVQVLRYLSF